jgi:glycolate oxidase FAD binding subunit
VIIDTIRLTGIVEHAAGDLIMVVRAGTPMAALELGDQQLALDFPPGATVGGTVAAGASGPRRMLYGTARDLLIGMTVVRADGTVAHAGGKVVKNVAGYDLGKLFTGSFGTLGLITECAFRLHPRPAAAVVVRKRCAEPGPLVAAVLAAQVVPSALEIDVPAGGGAEVAVLLEGSPDGVRDRVAVVEKLLGGDVQEGVPEWWGVDPWGAGDVAVKLTARISRVPELLAAGVHVRGSAGTGVLYAAVTANDQTAGVVERLRGAATAAGGHAVVLRAPDGVRETLDMWGPVGGLAIMRRVKDQFDPGHRFAPGRFVGGI